jgi:hypothetical protein
VRTAAVITERISGLRSGMVVAGAQDTALTSAPAVVI